ncbi:MAG TPA: PKD domain-containing protein, partial [Bacteroidia bacterium]|nr:PKD domain-containing protein [Bacteroidia bacterium]
MKSKYIKPFVVLLFVFIATIHNGWSQQIKASDSTGCAPFVGIIFTGIPGATNVNWNFGDGSSSGILNPTHTFGTPGNYTVTFTSSNFATQTIPIKVYGKPAPKFVTNDPKKGCTPLVVKFQDQSIGGGGSQIVAWSWSFGDGGVNTSNNPTPTYTYNIGGQFNVSLIVTDANGCDSSYSISQYITASKKPTLVVVPTASIVAACAPPTTVTFNGTGTTSNSTTGSSLTYSWNFGNGITSNVVAPPAVTYTAYGTYDVKFIATDNNGCADSVTKKVVVNNPVASFFVKDTVCKTVTFTNNSTGGSPFWNYGDGTSGVSNTHTYATAGTYTVKLTVTAGACSDDTVRTILVEDVKAQFTSVPKYICDLPASISYQDQSTNAVAWNWSVASTYTYFIASPTTSTAQNPTFLFSNKDTNEYTIYKPQYINVTLEVTSAHGCKNTVTIAKHDTINLPTARFMPDTTEGCVPLAVQFSDSSISKEPIVNWQYIFGDGTSISGSNPTPTHTYTAAGTYYAMLVIQNSKGCIDTSYRIKINVGNLPNPDFSATPLNVCPGDTVKFTDLTPASDSVDTWH